MGNEFYLLKGDAHPTRMVKVTLERDGDVNLSIIEDGSMIEEKQGSAEPRKAIVEFCANGGRHHHVRALLRMFPEAIAADNAELSIQPK